MPSMMMLSDSQFPRFTDEAGQEERIDVIHDYLYQLLEQLRYTLANLGADNFNDTALIELGDGITADLDNEVQLIHTRLTGITGSIAELTLTGDALKASVKNVENDVAELTLTASEFNLRLSDAEDGVAEISATVAGLTFSVSNGESSSKLKLMSNGVELASATIRITGMVTFDDLEGEGSTVINGANISTGFIKTIGIDSCDIVGGTVVGTELIGTTIKGSSVYLYYDHDEYGTSSIYYKWESLNIARMYMAYDANASGSVVYFRIRTYNEAALKLDSDAGISLEAATCIYISAPDYISLDSEVVNIHNAILYTADGNSWEFLDDGIYFAGEKVFDL